MNQKVHILITVDEEFAEILYDMKKILYGRSKGAQSKTVQDALIALARQKRFESALAKIKEARDEIKEIQKEVSTSSTK